MNKIDILGMYMFFLALTGTVAAIALITDSTALTVIGLVCLGLSWFFETVFLGEGANGQKLPHCLNK